MSVALALFAFACERRFTEFDPVADLCGDDGPCTMQCTPATCEDFGALCGELSDGCGGKLFCGQCASWTHVPGSNDLSHPPTDSVPTVRATSSPSAPCAALIESSPVELKLAWTRSIRIHEGETCGVPIGDGKGRVVFPVRGVNARFAVMLSPKQPHYEARFEQVVAQREGFHTLSRAGSGPDLEMRPVFPNGEPTPLGTPFARIGADPSGGTVVNVYSIVNDESVHRAVRFDAAGVPTWTSDVYARFPTSSRVQPPEPVVMNDSQVAMVFDTRYGRGLVRWFSATGQLLGSGGGLVAGRFPLHDGGFCGIGTYVDEPIRWERHLPGSSSTEGCPAWLGTVTLPDVHRTPRGDGYVAVFEANGDACTRRIEVRATTGELCATTEFTWESSSCNRLNELMAVALDGTLLELDLGSTGRCEQASCECTYRGWDGLVRGVE